ncbi:spore germination protein [Paenibacillus jilunlii]|uniref:GerA spore germination protein n=1 Tax=Paenibacillus jilunlii TaxID=682956 RepID=A0A1G9KIQ1_9BACL|nr:spore germination protein [Paenibacillus jilunlii]KWX69926.1 spore gernimation protein GerA [Paenibacillus jilunlii]SDL49377.1 GerA spore germination protein [Paenibacillus jilunlii]
MGFISRIKEQYAVSDDFFILNDYLLETPVILMGFNSLMDWTLTKQNLQTYINTAADTGLGLEEFRTVLGQVETASGMDKASAGLLQGKLIIYFEQENSFIVMDTVARTLDRSITPPVNENVFQGTLSSFTEDINSNIGILRKQIQSSHVNVSSYTIGSEETRQLTLVYYEGHADVNLIEKIKMQIEQNKHQQIDNLQQLSQRMMGFRNWTLVPNLNQTELPEEAANFLRNGRALLFMDRLPVAVVLPSLLWDIFVLGSDRHMPLPLMMFLRALRVIGVMLTLILPGTYVALVSVNPEVLRIELALSIAQTREGIPYPAIVEIVLMLLILELIIEASIRLPKNIGPTITMVGGIILGEAVVQAKLVSNLLIIILAATTIANSTIIGLQQSLSLRIAKYIIVILAAIYGVFGIMEGLVLVFAYLSSLHPFGIPYTSIMRCKKEVNHG